MYAISDVIKELQKQNGLDLKDDFQFPVELFKDVERYWEAKNQRHCAEGKKNVKEPDADEDWLYNSLKSYYARRWLAYVTFSASIAVAFLAVLVLVFELILPSI